MSKRRLTLLTIFIVFIVGIFVVGIFVVFFYGQKNQKISPVAQKSLELPLMEVTGVKFTELDTQGKKLWVLMADKAVQMPRETILKNVDLKLFEKGNPVSEGIAKQVIIENSTSNLLLEGEICITSYRDGAELRTSQLQWNNSKKEFYTEKEVTIKRKGAIIQGTGLTGKPDLSLIIIKNQVTTYFEGGG